MPTLADKLRGTISSLEAEKASKEKQEAEVATQKRLEQIEQWQIRTDKLIRELPGILEEAIRAEPRTRTKRILEFPIFLCKHYEPKPLIFRKGYRPKHFH